jgi:hypothetical protein
MSSTLDGYAGDTTTNGGLPVNGSANGKLDTIEDKDWFKIQLSELTTYRFVATGLPDWNT